MNLIPSSRRFAAWTALSAVLFISIAALARPASPASAPAPFTGHLTEIDGVQAIVSLKHPKLVNRDLEKLMAQVPEAAVMRMGLSSLSAFGYPQFSEIASGSNFGVALLNFSAAEAKTNPPVLIGFAQLKEGGKLWNVLAGQNLALRKHGEWTLIAKDEETIAGLKSPDAVIAFLEKPQIEDLRLWLRTSPAFVASIENAVVASLQPQLAPLSPQKHTAALAYLDAVTALVQQLHSAELAVSFTDAGLQLAEIVQAMPDSAAGVFLRSRPGPAPALARSISSDALGVMVARNDPAAFREFAASVFDALIAVNYPPGSVRLKQMKSGALTMFGAIDGEAVVALNLGLERQNGRDQLKPRIFYVLSGHATREIVRSYFNQIQSLNSSILKASQAKLRSMPGMRDLEYHTQLAEDALTVDGIPFDSLTNSATLKGVACSTSTQYYGVVDGNLVLADSEATLAQYLPALRSKAALPDGIQLPEIAGESQRGYVNGGKLVDFIAEAGKLDRKDPDVSAQIEDLKAGFAASGPATAVAASGQARIVITVSLPYKFIEASVRLGEYMSAQKINLLQFLTPAVPPAQGHESKEATE